MHIGDGRWNIIDNGYAYFEMPVEADDCIDGLDIIMNLADDFTQDEFNVKVVAEYISVNATDTEGWI